MKKDKKDNENSWLVKIEILGVVSLLASGALFMTWRFMDLDNLGWDALLDDKYAIAGEAAMGYALVCFLYIAYRCFRDNQRKNEECESDKSEEKNIVAEEKSDFVYGKKTVGEKIVDHWEAIKVLHTPQQNSM